MVVLLVSDPFEDASRSLNISILVCSLQIIIFILYLALKPKGAHAFRGQCDHEGLVQAGNALGRVCGVDKAFSFPQTHPQSLKRCQLLTQYSLSISSLITQLQCSNVPASLAVGVAYEIYGGVVGWAGLADKIHLLS